MFNSQKINNDPVPYIVSSIEDGDYRISVEDFFGYRTEYAPRPEYDNNPNPLLEAFRDFLRIVGYSEFSEKLRTFLIVILFGMKQFFNPYHIEHARKVLERIVRIYGK